MNNHRSNRLRVRGRPLPLSRAQLDDIRNALRELVRQRGATYRQVSQQLDVDEDVLKAFCLGRSVRPRGEFLVHVTHYIRRIGPFFEDTGELQARYNSTLANITDSIFNRSWYDDFYKSLGVTRHEVFAETESLAGRYVLYRNSGNGRTINKTSLHIDHFDEDTGRQEITITRTLPMERQRLSRGFLLPIHGRFVILARIGDADGVLAIFFERISDDNLTGIMLTINRREPIFATRMLFVRITNKNKAIDGNYGIISQSQLIKEVPNEASVINNELDDWAVLQTLKF